MDVKKNILYLVYFIWIFFNSAIKTKDDKNKEIYANAIIIATGAEPTKLGCPGEDFYLGKGLAICADCDAPLSRNKEVVVIGGSNSALREIDILTKYTDKITIIN